MGPATALKHEYLLPYHTVQPGEVCVLSFACHRSQCTKSRYHAGKNSVPHFPTLNTTARITPKGASAEKQFPIPCLPLTYIPSTYFVKSMSKCCIFPSQLTQPISQKVPKIPNPYIPSTLLNIPQDVMPLLRGATWTCPELYFLGI